jgi:hypothetical protein
VEAFEAAGVTFVRDGKDIYTQNNQTQEEHQQFLALVRDEMLPRLRDERTRLRERLDEILKEADAVDLLARAGFLYLPIDPDTFKEWENDRSPGHIEYLALQVLPSCLDQAVDVHPMEAASLTGEVIGLVRELFEIENQLLAFGMAQKPEVMHDQTEQYRVRSQMESLSVRGSAYTEHVRAILLGTLGQFDTECERLLGFTAEQAINLVPAIAEVVGLRLAPRLEEADAARAMMLAQLPKQRRKGVPGPVPDWIVNMKPTEAKRWVRHIALMWTFSNARELATFTAADVAEVSGIPEANVAAFLAAFTCTPDNYRAVHHRFPVGAHPLTEAPILRVQDGYMLPVPSAMFEALRPRMEDLLQRADANVWDRYAKARADFVETESVRRLREAIPGANGFTGLGWKSTSDESDLDGLVAVDAFTLRIQTKAGRVHAPSRRGAPERMRANLTALIKEAAQQHQALDLALKAEGAVAIGLGRHQQALELAPFQVEVIVCLDDVTVWATESHHLRKIEMLPADRPIPWILSLADLMAVTDILQGAQLLHYITRRVRLEAFGKIAAHDELDWVGYYIDRGLYFEDMFEGPDAPSEYRLLSFTEAFDAWYFTREGVRDVPAPKPKQPLPSRVAALIEALEDERPPQWTIGALSLLMGSDVARQEVDNRLANAANRRLTHGWSNGTQVFEGIVGFTYFMDYRPPRDNFPAKLSAYVDEKMTQGYAPNWIAIGDCGDGTLRVEVRSQHPDGVVRVFIPHSNDVSDGQNT